MKERTIIRLFVALVVVYVLAWAFWERIPELAHTIPYYEEMVGKSGNLIERVEAVRDFIFNNKQLSESVRENRWTIAGAYALFGLSLLIIPKYRNNPKRFTDFCRTGCMVLGGVLLLISMMWLGTAVDGILKPETHYSYPTHSNIGPFVGNMVSGTAHALLMIAFMIVIFIGFYGGLYVGLPIAFLFLLFLLPGVVYDMLHFAVRAPFLLWRYLHYLTVPHPMEGVITEYEVRMKRGVKIDHAAFGEAMSRAKYDPKRDGIPVWWKSENWSRRLKNAMALRSRVKTEKQAADEYIDDLRERNKQQQ